MATSTTPSVTKWKYYYGATPSLVRLCQRAIKCEKHVITSGMCNFFTCPFFVMSVAQWSEIEKRAVCACCLANAAERPNEQRTARLAVESGAVLSVSPLILPSRLPFHRSAAQAEPLEWDSRAEFPAALFNIAFAIQVQRRTACLTESKCPPLKWELNGLCVEKAAVSQEAGGRFLEVRPGAPEPRNALRRLSKIKRAELSSPAVLSKQL